MNMAFPNDLSDVSAFKIHPAIGCARLANNDDYYEFFDYHAVREAGRAQTLKYMSVHDGKHWMKRQAVQFRIFAYGPDGGELGELTREAMAGLGITPTWTASVANRKLYVWSRGATPAVLAQASATGGETKILEGDNPWRAGKVWLGHIRGDGLFIPPKGGVYRQTEDRVIPGYNGHASDNGVMDTTSDGSISVVLAGAGNLPVIPAAIIVAPQDHSPDVNPEHIEGGTNRDFVKETRQLLGIAVGAALVGNGYDMDIAMMKTMNAEYNPGMEIGLRPSLALPDPEAVFFPRGTQHIHENEIRPSYEAGRAQHGQLTAGLCSTWQTDLNACLNYWTSTYPYEVGFDTDPQTRVLARKEYAVDGEQMQDPEWLNSFIDMMEVARNTDDDQDSLRGTERDANDDAGEAPEVPFPLEPRQPPAGTV
ncbi:LodA/GoxA family CTQ-dependent oxidase [Rhizobium ruizarguesonis]